MWTEPNISIAFEFYRKGRNNTLSDSYYLEYTLTLFTAYSFLIDLNENDEVN